MLSPEQKTIIENYYRYYRTFPLSGAVELHTGSISWIMPKKGEKGPAIAFDLRLDPQTAQREIDGFISAIQQGSAPRQLIVTPDAKRYYTWAESGTYRFYLGELGGVPVSTAAAIPGGNTASLEFVSTLEEYRQRHAASSLCSMAIAGLFEAGARTVTLSGSADAVRLYEGLGFCGYFNNIIMRYGQADV